MRGGVAFPNDFKSKDRVAELARRHDHLENGALEPQRVAASNSGAGARLPGTHLADRLVS